MTIVAERFHDFSCGHRVHGHESKCAHLHGHNYRITFTCAPARPQRRRFMGQEQAQQDNGLDSIGRVLDFSVIKDRLCNWLEDNWDHKFLIWQRDPLAADLMRLDPDGVVMVPFNPTAENMADYLVNVVGPEEFRDLPVALVACKVEETRKCSATFVL